MYTLIKNLEKKERDEGGADRACSSFQSVALCAQFCSPRVETAGQSEREKERKTFQLESG